MKMTIEVDCTPEEARRFMGLPDVSGLNDHLVKEMQSKITANMSLLSADELIIGLSGPFFAMAGGAFCCIHGFTLFRSPTARRQADAVWTNADVPRSNFLRCCHSSEIGTFRRECNGRSHGKT